MFLNPRQTKRNFTTSYQISLPSSTRTTPCMLSKGILASNGVQVVCLTSVSSSIYIHCFIDSNMLICKYKSF
uniref:Uncharacterized protein n=1 Tax=Lepeophtheirus salmonis TaxID=72036 RepID=A0A0K2TET8_LEPSM